MVVRYKKRMIWLAVCVACLIVACASGEVGKDGVPKDNRYCRGKNIVVALAGSENKSLEIRDSGRDSIIEQFNRQSKGVCLDLIYSGTTEIGRRIKSGNLTSLSENSRTTFKNLRKSSIL